MAELNSAIKIKFSNYKEVPQCNRCGLILACEDIEDNCPRCGAERKQVKRVLGRWIYQQKQRKLWIFKFKYWSKIGFEITEDTRH